MSRAIQLSLPISIEIYPTNSKDAKEKYKRSLMKGRPRRLENGSSVIKASIPPNIIRSIDRICKRMAATRPEVVRNAVQRFIQKYKDLSDVQHTDNKHVIKPEKGRCIYLKVPFPPEDLKYIGHGVNPKKDIEASGLCKLHGMTRQEVISKALDEFITTFVSG